MSRAHSHYFKDVSRLAVIDVYRVCDLFKVDDPSGATQHALKKLLLPGQRGGKGLIKDLREARDSIQRRLDMLEEDALALVPEAERAEIPSDSLTSLATKGVREPVGADLRFDQSGRQDAVEQNGNTGEHYLPDGLSWESEPWADILLEASDGDARLLVWGCRAQAVGKVAVDFGSQKAGSLQTYDLNHPGSQWRVVAARKA